MLYSVNEKAVYFFKNGLKEPLKHVDGHSFLSSVDLFEIVLIDEALAPFIKYQLQAVFREYLICVKQEKDCKLYTVQLCFVKL